MTQLKPSKDWIVTYKTDTHRYYPSADYRSFLAIYRAKSGLGPLPSFDPDNLGSPRPPRVDLCRWIGDCPACASAVVADDEDLVFICPTCGSDGKWSLVIMPEKKNEIEELLLLRPGFREANLNRFWSPGESIEKLAAENYDHGVPVPPDHKKRIEDAIALAETARAAMQTEGN